MSRPLPPAVNLRCTAAGRTQLSRSHRIQVLRSATLAQGVLVETFLYRRKDGKNVIEMLC